MAIVSNWNSDIRIVLISNFKTPNSKFP